ncbi:MAG: 50S ribosomal protein L25 [bacterium]
MKEIEIAVSPREGVGKGFARRERMAGRIPAIVYGPEVEPLSVAVDEKELRRAMKEAGGFSSIFDVNLDGRHNKVVVRDVQRDPITSKITHIDFHAVSMTKPLSISIPIIYSGTPVGVKVDGGIMQVTMRELEISCLPADIPDQLKLDVSGLGIGDSIHVRDVEIPNVKIISPAQRTMVVIAAPTVIKEAVAAGDEEGVAGEEGAAAAEAGEGEGDGDSEGDDKKK